MTGPSPIRLVLFDMDDVLCDYDWRGRVEALAAMSGRSFAALEAEIWNSGFEDAADRGEIDADSYLEGFAERLGKPFSRRDWITNRRAAMTPWPDMLELARLIAERCTIAILTNNGLLTRDAIDALFPELRAVFGERILFSAELGAQKPDPEVYRRALARLGFRPEETLFTDDKPENVEGAVAAGLHGHVHQGPAALKARLKELGLILA
jgi:putative hydrolase of the HAD superfamily